MSGGTVSGALVTGGTLSVAGGSAVMDGNGISVKDQSFILKDSSGNTRGWLYGGTDTLNLTSYNGKGLGLNCNQSYTGTNLALGGGFSYTYLVANTDVIYELGGASNHVRPDADDKYILGGNTDWRWKQINGMDIVDHSPTFPILDSDGYLGAIGNIQVNTQPHPVNKVRDKVVVSSLPEHIQRPGDGVSLGPFIALAIGAIEELHEKVIELEERVEELSGPNNP